MTISAMWCAMHLYFYVYMHDIHACTECIHLYIHCTWFLSEDMSNEGVLQRSALLLTQFVERSTLGGGEEVGLQFSGVDQHRVTLEPHLLQQVKLRGKREDRGLNYV